jgi:hypothetical protein
MDCYSRTLILAPSMQGQEIAETLEIPRVYKHPSIVRTCCETGELFCGRTIVTFLTTYVFSYAMFWLSRTGETGMRCLCARHDVASYLG